MEEDEKELEEEEDKEEEEQHNDYSSLSQSPDNTALSKISWPADISKYSFRSFMSIVG